MAVLRMDTRCASLHLVDLGDEILTVRACNLNRHMVNKNTAESTTETEEYRNYYHSIISTTANHAPHNESNI